MRVKTYPRVAVVKMVGPSERSWWVLEERSFRVGRVIAQQDTHAGALAVAIATAYPRQADPERWTP